MEQKRFETTFNGKTYTGFYIKEKEVALNALSDLMSDPEVAFGIDIETMPKPEYRLHPEGGLSPHLSDIRLIQVLDTSIDVIYVFDCKYLNDNEIFIPFLEQGIFIAHNAIFELSFFRMMGVGDMNINCSMLALILVLHAIYPTDAGTRNSLEAACLMLFDVQLNKSCQTSNWSADELTFEQVKYAADDCPACVDVMNALLKLISKFGMERVYKLIKDVQHPVSDMQINGILFDKTTHRHLLDEWRKELHQARLDVIEKTGIDSVTGPQVAKWLEENLTPQELLMWTRTAPSKTFPNGQLSTSKDTMAQMSHLAVVEPFARYQKKETLISTYGQKLADKVNKKTGRIHGNFIIQGARTGRFSAREPNMQNAPRDEYFRNLFRASEGYKLVCADYNQIELRVAAELSQDEAMLEAYRSGIDLHALTASKVARCPLDKVTKRDRQYSKSLNFGLLFGLGASKFVAYAKNSYGVDTTFEEAEDAIKVFRETYSGYRKWQLDQAAFGEQRLFATTPCGKFRKLDPTNTFGTSMNTPVQGGAAEIMCYALVYIRKRLIEEQLDARMLITVHDEVILEARAEIAEYIKQLMKEEMTKGFLEVFPNGITNGLVKADIGDTWGEAK